MAEPLAPEPNTFEATELKKVWKDAYHQALIKFQHHWFRQEVNEYVLMYISSLILFGMRRSFLVCGIIVPTYVKVDKTVCIYWGISLLTTTYKILPNIPLSRLTLNAD